MKHRPHKNETSHIKPLPENPATQFRKKMVLKLKLIAAYDRLINEIQQELI